MFKIFSAQQCKGMDNATINSVTMQSIVLMGNAAIKLCRELLHMGDLNLVF